MKTFLLWTSIASLILLSSGCGLTLTGAEYYPKTETTPEMMKCHSSTYTFGKDVSGASLNCGDKAGWKVESSDPNQAMVNGFVMQLQMIQQLQEMLKKASVK